MLVNETQKTAIFKTDDDDLREELAQSRESMRLYAMEVDQELHSVQELVNQLEKEVSCSQRILCWQHVHRYLLYAPPDDLQKKNFLNYFEEEDTLPIDELLGFIASFTEEFDVPMKRVSTARRAGSRWAEQVQLLRVVLPKCPIQYKSQKGHYQKVKQVYMYVCWFLPEGFTRRKLETYWYASSTFVSIGANVGDLLNRSIREALESVSSRSWSRRRSSIPRSDIP
ncbi:unnamed protein product [Phytophthora fragariaefolia]|uniref:Unnamed protein product n=1 Tax=Phytophthora fragariaefolia TaxID=1490495 RepID=A0A9W7CZI1_9STRA|nr:unnamed protein product [Phytophthora fragariaefolia]